MAQPVIAPEAQLANSVVGIPSWLSSTGDLEVIRASGNWHICSRGCYESEGVREGEVAGGRAANRRRQ